MMEGYDAKRTLAFALVLVAAVSVPVYLLMFMGVGSQEEVVYPYNPPFSEHYSGGIMQDGSCFPALHLIPNSSFFLRDYTYVVSESNVTVVEDGLRFDRRELRSPQGLIIEKYFICDIVGENATAEEISQAKDSILFPNVTNPSYYYMQFGELDSTYVDELEPISASVTPSLAEIYSMSLSDMDGLSWEDIEIEKRYNLVFSNWTADCPCRFRIWISSMANSTYNFDFGDYDMINATFGEEGSGSKLTVSSNENGNQILEVWFG